MTHALSAALAAYRDRLDDLNEIGEQMGEMSALVADMAAMLSHYPQRYAGIAGDWPLRADLETTFTTWGERHAALLQAWGALNGRDQILAGPLPCFDAPDPSLPIV